MAFHEVQFPTNLSYNTRGGPTFDTAIMVSDGGTEHRIPRMSQPKHRYNARWSIRSLDDLYLIKEFYIARRGCAYGFRFLDPIDCSSASDGRSAPQSDDQQIGVGDGTTTQFQLIKSYSSGYVTRTRIIEKPHADDWYVEVNGVLITSGVTLNTSTGIVTFTTPPANGHVVKAGYYFDVPVRFEADLEKEFEASIEGFETGSIGDIPLIEILNENSTVDEFYYGGGEYFEVSGDMTLVETNGRAISINPSVAGLKATLPLASTLPKGGPHFYINNSSGTHDLAVWGPTLLTTLSPSHGCACIISSTSGGSNEWIIIGNGS